MVAKFNSIIFDCDGVLIDSELTAHQIEAEVKTELGFPTTLVEQLEKFVGIGMNHPAMETELQRLPAEFWQTVEHRLMNAYISELNAIDGVFEVLEKLSLPKCVASSSEPDWLTFKLDRTNLSRHFVGTTFHGRMVERTKPAPDLFLHAIDYMGWEHNSTLVIEDSVVGVLAGKAAGLTVWGFAGGSHVNQRHREYLMAAGASHVFTDMRDVLKIRHRE